MGPRRTVFAPLAAAVLLAAAGGVVALRASHAAASFHPRLNLPVPALAAARPFDGPAPTRLARRVVIVVIDGLRLDASFGSPLLDSLRRAGVEAVGHAGFPTWSRPNQAAVVTGVPPVASGVRTNDYGFPVRLDSLMDRAGHAGLSSAYVADVSFGVARMFNTDFDASHYVPWPGGLDKALRLVLGQDYALIVVIPGAVDEAGHEFGAADPAYREAIVEVDRVLGETLGHLDLERDAVIVTADHGHVDRGGHGGTEPEVVEVPFILAGAGVRAGAALGDVDLIDVAPTAAALLGLPAPGHGLGRTLVEALTLSDRDRAAIVAADHDRIARNQFVVERAAVTRQDLAHATRVRRLVSVALALVLAIAGLAALVRVGAIQLDLRVLAIGLPAFPLTYYLLLDRVGAHFSLSVVPDRTDALARLLDFALIATAVQVVASWVALHDRRVLRERLAAAAGLSSVALLVSWIPAGILWALYDPDSQPVLASGIALVLCPATWIAVAYVALAAAVTLGLEVIVFFARGLDPRLRLRRLKRATERVRAELDQPD